MTRTVMDAALLMNELTRPDARDYMCLPYEEMNYPKLPDGEVKGKRIGLLLDIGTGLTLQPAVRHAIDRRSEENPSDLQSLMRNSSPVFSLKNNKPITEPINTQPQKPATTFH